MGLGGGTNAAAGPAVGTDFEEAARRLSKQVTLFARQACWEESRRLPKGRYAYRGGNAYGATPKRAACEALQSSRARVVRVLHRRNACRGRLGHVVDGLVDDHHDDADVS